MLEEDSSLYYCGAWDLGLLPALFSGPSFLNPALVGSCLEILTEVDVAILTSGSFTVIPTDKPNALLTHWVLISPTFFYLTSEVF